MPKQFRKYFKVQGHTVHYRVRDDWRYHKIYEARYAKKPFDKHPISASGKTLAEVKANFIKKLNNTVLQDDATPTIPKTFDGFALYWFENFHKKKVAEKTYKKNLDTYKRDIQKVFAQAKIADILPVQIQKFLEGFNEKERTKETLHSILNQVFECAVKHGIVKLNPLDMCFYQKHEREHGVAFTKEEEKLLISAYEGSPFQMDFVVALYTGLRPGEYKTATIEGNFIVARNSKRKNGKIEYKRIPITPMLRPYLVGVEILHLHYRNAVTKYLKRVLPNHTLKDMRKTFQTRCTELEVSEVAIGMFMGNGIGSELKKTYTEVSDEWLLKEAEKFNY